MTPKDKKNIPVSPQSDIGIPYTAEKLPNHKIGRYTYGVPNIHHWGESAELIVGSFCSIAQEVTIFLGGNHRPDWVTTYPFNVLWKPAKHIEGHPATKGDVTIGNDVWIGFGVTIMSGVTICDGAVIGARAVVTKDVPPYAIAVGNPAKIVKYRFTPDVIKSLLEKAWWDWSDEKIARNFDILLSSPSCD